MNSIDKTKLYCSCSQFLLHLTPIRGKNLTFFFWQNVEQKIIIEKYQYVSRCSLVKAIFSSKFFFLNQSQIIGKNQSFRSFH